MLRWMLDTGQQPDVSFVHSARSPVDIIFHQELLAADAQWPNLQLSILSEQQAPGCGWSGYRGRLNASLLAHICPDYNQRIIMCCGPAPYMQAVRSMLEELGFPMQNYVEESFGTPPVAPVQEESSAAEQLATEITFSNSSIQTQSDSNTSLLDAAQAGGVWIQAACRSGICGSCKVMKTSGEVTMENPMALSDSDREAGFILACCAFPQTDVTIQA